MYGQQKKGADLIKNNPNQPIDVWFCMERKQREKVYYIKNIDGCSQCGILGHICGSPRYHHQ